MALEYDKNGNPIPHFTCIKLTPGTQNPDGRWEITDDWSGESSLISQQLWDAWNEAPWHIASKLPKSDLI